MHGTALQGTRNHELPEIVFSLEYWRYFRGASGLENCSIAVSCKLANADICCTSFFVVVLGYSIYSTVVTYMIEVVVVQDWQPMCLVMLSCRRVCILSVAQV